jgi:hypothetical protein
MKIKILVILVLSGCAPWYSIRKEKPEEVAQPKCHTIIQDAWPECTIDDKNDADKVMSCIDTNTYYWGIFNNPRYIVEFERRENRTYLIKHLEIYYCDDDGIVEMTFVPKIEE